jgi:hypothetical protein
MKILNNHVMHRFSALKNAGGGAGKGVGRFTQAGSNRFTGHRADGSPDADG